MTEKEESLLVCPYCKEEIRDRIHDDGFSFCRLCKRMVDAIFMSIEELKKKEN